MQADDSVVTTVTNERGGRPPHFTCREITTPTDVANDRRTYICAIGCPGVSRETSGNADARALADRRASGCALRRGEPCLCPAAPYAYDRCARRVRVSFGGVDITEYLA